MIEERDLLERALRNFEPEPGLTDRVYRRRDRKRRNQRIAAGVVGIAVFAAAVWVVTSVKSLDRTEKTVVPAASGTTGRAETGPRETGAAETGTAKTGHSAGWNGVGLPPEEAVVSTPVEGRVIAESTGSSYLYVYADGRVISHASPFNRQGPVVTVERRLTPVGVELVRSGAVGLADVDPLHLPADAWADPKARIYVPARYAICNGHNVNPSDIARLLPARAAALLQGKEQTYEHSAGQGGNISPRNCFEVTTDEARELVAILTAAGVDGDIEGLEFVVADPSTGRPISIEFRWLLPQGEWVRCCLG